MKMFGFFSYSDSLDFIVWQINPHPRTFHPRHKWEFGTIPILHRYLYLKCLLYFRTDHHQYLTNRIHRLPNFRIRTNQMLISDRRTFFLSEKIYSFSDWSTNNRLPYIIKKWNYYEFLWFLSNFHSKIPIKMIIRFVQKFGKKLKWIMRVGWWVEKDSDWAPDLKISTDERKVRHSQKRWQPLRHG